MPTLVRTPLDYYLNGSDRTRTQQWYWRLACGHLRLVNIVKCHRTKDDKITCFCTVCLDTQEIVARAERD